MRIEVNRITPPITDRDHCYVHARGLILRDGYGIITTQRLDIRGCDVFGGIELMESLDGGKSFSPPRLCKGLTRTHFKDGSSFAMCDATPSTTKKAAR